MGVIGVILLVAFIIICILLVCIVLIQNDAGGGIGGLLGGSNSVAFGSRSGNVLTKTTYILVTLFFVATFVLAFINKAPSVHSLDAAAAQEGEATTTEGSWLDQEAEDGEASEPVAATNSALGEDTASSTQAAETETTSTSN